MTLWCTETCQLAHSAQRTDANDFVLYLHIPICQSAPHYILKLHVPTTDLRLFNRKLGRAEATNLPIHTFKATDSPVNESGKCCLRVCVVISTAAKKD